MVVFIKRRGWDSNPRALSDKRFSRPPRYDHFDTSPYIHLFIASVSATCCILAHSMPLRQYLFCFFLIFLFSRTLLMSPLFRNALNYQRNFRKHIKEIRKSPTFRSVLKYYPCLRRSNRNIFAMSRSSGVVIFIFS